eukprot:m.182498 g.182498  ORF g.182498 m.182498 type:complete len:260 (-) comp13591_c0_seq7:771-1550(-)
MIMGVKQTALVLLFVVFSHVTVAVNGQCVDNNAAIAGAGYGSCSAIVALCNDANYGTIIQTNCPVTCGVCTPTTTSTETVPTTTTKDGTTSATTTSSTTTTSTTTTTTMTSTTTTTTLATRTCTGGQFSDDSSMCDCGDANCFSCDIASGEDPVCSLCSNSKYLYEGSCNDDCDSFRDTFPRGSVTFGRTCIDGEQCLVSSGTCTCNENCVECLESSSGSLKYCEVCGNQQYLFDGECTGTCPNGFTESGTNDTGRECV